MPKIKSHSGAKKRFILTARGKVKHKKSGLRHLLTGMPASRGRRLRHSKIISDNTTVKLIHQLLPYK